MPLTNLPVINAIWIGSELGQIHAACLRSFLRVGHEVVLHCYSAPVDAPKGVKLADAAKLLPKDRLVRHRESNSYSLFSNLLRYELLRAGLGLYVDCDMFCVRPIEDEDHIFGWSSPKSINNAVLKLPADSRVLGELCKIKDGAFIPPWCGLSYRMRVRLGLMLGRPAPALEELPWGWTGPKALTWYANRYGISRLGKSQEVFYPLDNSKVALLFDPDRTIDDLITPRTLAVHLYNEYFKRRSLHAIPVPPSSPLGRMIAAK